MAVVLITGAGSGIGRATALAFAARHDTVLCADVNAEAAEKTAAECAERGAADTGAFAVDVADRHAVDAVAEKVTEAYGPLDVLVNNAGVGMTGRFNDMAPQDWEWIRGVNLDGVVHGCAAFAPAMLAAGRGHVVNVSSGLAYTPTANEPAYVATKAAVLALSHCLRADYQASGVGVTAVCPGVINTPIIDATRFVGPQDPGRHERVKKLFRRGHKPEEVAAVIVRAVERNKAVAAAGWEAKLGWWLHRLAPLSLQQAIARRGVQ